MRSSGPWKISQKFGRASMPARMRAWLSWYTSLSSMKRRMTNTSSAGTMPIMNKTRQAVSGAMAWKARVERIAAAAQPTAQPACMEPSALPRCSARMVSPSSTAPAAHSPPKPKPINARQMNSCV